MRFFIFIVIVGVCRANHLNAWDLVDMRRMLLDGEATQTYNALPNHLLQFNYSNITWEQGVDVNDFGKQWYRRNFCKECAKPIEDWLMKNIEFFKILIPHKNISHVNLTMTKYTEGDYLDLHTDYRNADRLLTFVLHLNSIDPICGGEFIWAGNKGIKRAVPMENVLYMFVPSTHSWHSIEKVHCGERYAISGWFY